MNNLDYIYAVSRIRVKEKSLLTDADIQAMTAMDTEQDVMEYLKARGWGGESADASAEEMLAAEERRMMDVILDLGLDQETLDILSYPRLFHNLKTGIQEITTSESHVKAFYDMPDFDREKVENILKKHDFDELPEMMRDVAQRALEVMLKTRDGQIVDTMVDRVCMESMTESAEHAHNRLLRRYIELTNALTDIRIAVRGRKMKKPRDYFENALAATELLDVKQLADAASAPEKVPGAGENVSAAADNADDPLYRYLKRAGFEKAVEALKESPASFERWCDDELIDLIRPMRTVNESVGPVLAYYLARENEIKTVRIILTAKANDFPEEVIAERARKMYV